MLITPTLGILPHARVSGMAAPHDGGKDLMTFMPLHEACRKEWPSDAHLTCYGISSPAGTGPTPRLKKSMLAHARSMGCEIYNYALVFDFDNDPHLPWKDGEVDNFLRRFAQASDKWPLMKEFSCLYTTRAGARAIYLLDPPLPADVAEKAQESMIDSFNMVGIRTDKLTDWTRLFRLPKVLRDSSYSSQDPNFRMYENWDKKISFDASQLPEPAPAPLYATIHEIQGNRPTPEEAMALLRERSKDGTRWTDTFFFKKAKTRLKGRDCYECIFEDQPLATEGSRDQTMHAYVGQATGLCYHIEDATPQHIYAMFLSAAQQLRPDEQNPDWSATLWSHVKRLWEKEDAKFRQLKAKAEPDPEIQQTIIESMISGMKEWCHHPFLHSEDEMQAAGFVLRHAIASNGTHNYVLMPNGYYSPIGLKADELAAYIRINSLNDLIPTKKLNASKAVVDKSAQEIRGDYAIPVARTVEMLPNLKGGILTDLGSENPKLVLSCYRLNSQLVPTYNPEVDEWLKALFGEENYEDGIRWIAWALAFNEGPICALSIVSTPGSGKGMFIQGLAECLERPAVADGMDVVGSTQGGLLRSPFVSIDEGWPSVQGMSASERFRQIVGNMTHMINEKYMPRMELRCGPRMVMTANNDEVIHDLTSGRTLRPSDREAIAVRLMHIDTTKEEQEFSASAWLKNRGGMAYTGKAGARWVADMQGESDYILAKHFLWLYQNRGEKPAQRLLVEGNTDNAIIFDLQTKSGATPIVVECLCKMLECHPMVRANWPGFQIHENRLFVLSSQVVEYYREHLSRDARYSLGQRTAANALVNLMIGEQRDAYVLKGKEATGRRRWIEINLKLLRQASEQSGWPTTLIEQMISDRKRAKIGAV